MITIEQAQINWPAISVIVGGCGLIIAIVGWFVLNKLSVRRDDAQRKERVSRAVSDFEITLNKWGKSIKDTHVPRNQVWTVTLSGGLDLYAHAINGVREQSIETLESFIRAIRPFLNSDGKARLDKAWQHYLEYNIEGRDEKDPETGQEFTSHTECKAGLIACLEQMKKIAQEIEI